MSAHFVTGASSFAVRGRAYPRQEEAAPAPAAMSASRGRRAWFAVALLLAALAAWQLGGAAWIHARAAVAQRLIAASWREAGPAGPKRPWPWADTRPIARLTVPARGVELFVLEGTSPRALAYGPGHVDGTAMPGGDGNAVVVAHRDTHFAFLRELRENDEIDVQDARGVRTRYRVREAGVVDKHSTRVLDAADSPQLTLITCWPFDAVRPGTADRYVVIADRQA